MPMTSVNTHASWQILSGVSIMVKSAFVKGKKAAPRRKPAVRRKAAKKTNVPEWASCSVRRTATPQDGNAMRTISNIQLVDFPRAVAIAKGYQFYRITSVKVTYKPVYDTYSSATLQQKPNFYYMLDKGASLPTTLTLEGMKQLGARPRAFDEKPITVTWKPAVLTDTQNSIGSIASQYKLSPWLTTNSGPDSPAWNPSQVQHNGLFWYMECPGVNQLINFEIECQFEFKAPLINLLAGAPATPMSYAALDNSPDGIEGGSDGITYHAVDNSGTVIS